MKNRDRLFGVVRIKDKAQLISSSVALLAELVKQYNHRIPQLIHFDFFFIFELKWLGYGMNNNIASNSISVRIPGG